jgi:putative peptidoglycan lipid II flippase
MLELITKWGKIDSSDIEKGARLIAIYSIGIVGIGLKEILDRAFYALKKTLVSAINGFIIMLINISLSLLLMKYFGAYGIPFAYSVASLSGSVILLIVLGKKVGGFLDSTLSVVIKSFLSSLVMSLMVLSLSRVLSMYLDESVIDRIIKLFVPTFAGVITYGVLLYILKVEQVKGIVSVLITKFSRKKKEN